MSKTKNNEIKTSINQNYVKTIFENFQLYIEKYIVLIALKFKDSKLKFKGFMKQ